MLEAPPLPGSIPHLSQENLKCQAALFLPSVLPQAMHTTAHAPLPALKAQEHLPHSPPSVTGGGCWTALE